MGTEQEQEQEQEGREFGEFRKPTELELHDRVNAHINISHESLGEEPMGIYRHFSTPLTTKALVDHRRFRVGSDPVNIFEGCRVEEPGMVLIECRSRTPFKHPTPEEKAEQDKTYLIRMPNNDIIRLGRFTLFELTAKSRCFVRSSTSELININVWIIPR